MAQQRGNGGKFVGNGRLSLSGSTLPGKLKSNSASNAGASSIALPKMSREQAEVSDAASLARTAKKQTMDQFVSMREKKAKK